MRTVARKIAEWVDRLGAVWVEGQLAQVTARAGTGTAFLVLRDPAADVSLQLTAPVGLVRGNPAVADGNRVIVHGKPSFFLGRGTLSLRVDEIRAVGIGELLARIERLRKLLAAEGLFDVARKRRPPFLPHCIGLVTGPGLGGRARRRHERAGPLARGAVPDREHRRAGRVGRAADRRRAGRARPRPGRRRDRARPRRRQRRGPAAVLRRDAVPGGRRVPHAGGLGDRARAGHAAGRPRRRRPLLDAHRGGPAVGARPRRGDRAHRGPARPGPPRAGRLGRPRAARARHPAGPARRPPAGDRRCTPSGCTGCRPTCAAPCCAGWTGARSTWSTPAPASPRSAPPRRWPAATRSSSASPTTRCCRCCARRARWPRATGCASAWPTGWSPLPWRLDPPRLHRDDADGPVEGLGYEQARDELAEVVRKLEAGGLSLDDAVALWERGEALARRCEEQLAGARERVQKVLDAAEGVAGR